MIVHDAGLRGRPIGPHRRIDDWGANAAVCCDECGYSWNEPISGNARGSVDNASDGTPVISRQPPEIEFWFEFASNYSYLSVMRIEEAARQSGVRIVWKPFLLGPIFRALGMETSPFLTQKEKGAHMWQDMVRQCRKYGLRLDQTQRRFPD